MRHPLILVALVFGLFLASCGGGGGTDAPTSTATTTPRRTETPARATPTSTSGPRPSPTATVVRATTARVEGSGTCLNVRSEPKTEARVLGCYPDGTSLAIWGDLVYGPQYDWLAVAAEPGERGWAVTDFLAFDRAGFPASYSVPVPAADTRTGVREVDALITAVHAGNAQGLARNISPITVGCIVTPQGIGAPPFCESGEPEGTKIKVLPSSQCEGFYTRVELIGDAFFSLVRGAPRVFAVFRVGASDANPNWPLGDYGVVFALASGWARTVYISSTGIVNVWYGCGGDAFEHAGRGQTFVLPPPPR